MKYLIQNPQNPVLAVGAMESLRTSGSFFVFPPDIAGTQRAYLRPLFVRRNLAADGRRHKRARCNLSVRAGYRRVPMEASGAYQLINEDTGEKVIVLGGTDALDSPIPSEEVLSWKAGHRKERSKKEGFDATGAEATVSVNEDSSKPKSHLSASVGSFTRLKAHRIRSLIKNSSRVSKEDSTPTRTSVQGTFPDEADIDSVDFLREKSNSVLLRQKELQVDIATSDKAQNRAFPNIIAKWDYAAADASLSTTKVASSLREWKAAGSVRSTSSNQLKQVGKKSAVSGFFSRKSFKQLGCSDDIIESLRSQMYLRPSHIQAMAYEPILEGKSCIVADQSGSGKTLAYLAPIIQRLRQEELLGLSKSLPRSPRIVILVPTAELASQVLNNCRSIAKYGVPFRSMVATGGFRQKTQLDNLQQQLDVLIATPGRFIFLLQEGFLELSNLKCVVLDEVDILYGDEGFEQVLQTLISSAPMATQYLFVTATLPVDIYNKLVEVFPDCEVTMGPGMHRTSSRLEEILVDCSGHDGEEKNPDTAFLNKKTALLQLVEESSVPKTIIFCNKIETCRKVENVLKRVDRKQFHVKALPFHAAVTQEIRLSNMKEFLDPQSKGSLFLICTDRASRGIDFTNVAHVILFDFPRDPSEYVRRVGRTARGAGGEGKAFVFVVGKQVSLAKRILERNQKGHPLHDVPSAYELETSQL